MELNEWLCQNSFGGVGGQKSAWNVIMTEYEETSKSCEFIQLSEPPMLQKGAEKSSSR